MNYGPREYGRSEPNEFAVFGFGGGLNIKSMPQELADNELTIALNVYLRSDGGIEQRKGMTARGAQISANRGSGIARFFQQVVNGVPVSPANRFLLAQIGGTLYNADTQAQIGAAGALGAAAKPWSVVQAFDSNHVLPPPAALTNQAPVAGGALAAGTYPASATYVNASGETLNSVDITVTVTVNQQFILNSPPALGNATGWIPYVGTANGASNTETKQSAALPIGTNYNVSAIVAGAAKPATNTALAPSDVLIICTGSGGPYVFDGSIIYTPSSLNAVAGARWCAAINGITWYGGIPSQPNLAVATQINQPENPFTFFSMTYPVTGLAPLGAGAAGAMVVGMVRGLSVIYGTGSSNFYQLDYLFPDGVVAGRTMIAVDGAIFFLGGVAVWRFDGQQIQRVSDKIEPWILNDPLVTDYPMNGDRTISFAWFYNNRLHIGYDSGGVGYCNTYIVFDLLAGGWTVLAGPTLAGACLLDGPGDSSPPICVAIDGQKGQVYTWDQYNGKGFNGHGVDDAGAAILAVAATKYFKLDKAGVDKELQNIYPEMFVEQFDGQIFANTNYGITQQPFNPTGTSGASFLWDSGNWDSSVWAAAGLQFFRPKLEVSSASSTSAPYEAFSFGIQNNPTDPPFRFAGISGTVVVLPRS